MLSLSCCTVYTTSCEDAKSGIMLHKYWVLRNAYWLIGNIAREGESVKRSNKYKKVTSRSPKGTLPAAVFKGAQIIMFLETQHFLKHLHAR